MAEFPDYCVVFRPINDEWWNDETYWYYTKEEALAHLEQFRYDNSGLYKYIRVEHYETGEVLSEIRF